MLRYLLAALICLFMISGIAAESWTILVYMAADNGLYAFAEQDLIQMQQAILPANVQVIVQADFSSASAHSGARRYQIEHSTNPSITSPVISELGAINSGDPRTLNEFIKWALARYASQRKMLVIWSHGDSWYKQETSKWICPDDSSESLMSIANGDMRAAFRDVPKFDILLLDACSMQSIEVVTELKPYADYIIASQDEVPLSGFPYQDILPVFNQDIGSIVQQIPFLYTASYAGMGSQNPHYQGIPVTCSAVKTSAIPVFNDALKAFVVENRDTPLDFYKIRNQCHEMNTLYADIDIMEFFSRIAAEDISPIITQSAANLLDLWNDCVVSYSAIEHFHPIGTATIWFPAQPINFSYWWSHYHKLHFADTEWLSFLNAMFEDESPPSTPEIKQLDIVMNTMKVIIYQEPDPDPLSFEIQLWQDGSIQTINIEPGYNKHAFSFTLPVSAAGYIKIRAIDQKGNSSGTDSLAFNVPPISRTIIVAPNPIRDLSTAMIKFFNEESDTDFRLSIYDIRGRKLFTKSQANLQAGENALYFGIENGLPDLASGQYFIRLEMGKRVYNSRFTVLK